MVAVVFTYGTCYSLQISNSFPYIAVYLSHVTAKTTHITSATSISFYKERTVEIFTAAIGNFA